MRTKQCLWAAAVVLIAVGSGVFLRCVSKRSIVDAGSAGRGVVSRYVGTRVPSSSSSVGRVGGAAPPGSVSSRFNDSGDPRPLQDRFAGAETIDLHVDPTSVPHIWRRKRLVQTTTKYPLVRVEETYSIDPKSGRELMLSQLPMVGDHVIARVAQGRTREDLATVAAKHGFTVRSEVGRGESACFLVAEPDAALDSVLVLIEVLGAEACVDLVEPDYLVRLAETTPNDPSYALLWGMNTIEMPKVWDMTVGTGGAVVAIFDTGVELDHPDLEANIWSNSAEIAGNGLDDDDNGYIDDIHGWDFYGDDNDATDLYGHGTHVAGTIGAVGNNGVGVAGVGWNTRIMPIQIFGPSAEFAGLSDVIAGVYYVITHRMRGVSVRVTNHSWGGDGYSQFLRDALQIAGGQGILHVAAAGNNGNLNNDIYPHYPSNYTLSNLVSVANTTLSDGLSGTSHYGATSVDIGAPGSSTYSSIPSSTYGYKSGTSMASPHVAGVAALMWDYMPHLTWQQVLQALYDGADVLPALTGRCVTEARLNAYGAIETLQPFIEHTPLENTTDVISDHIIEAHIRPSVPFLDTNRVVVLWNSTGSTNAFTTNIMHHVSNDLFRASIAAQPTGMAIYYMIRAETKTDLLSTHPVGAPAALHRFDVTYPVAFWILGYPAEYGTMDPAAGAHEAPWGSVVVASTSPHTVPVNGQRHRCSGWYGYGEVPSLGSSNTVSFVIRNASIVQWMWEEQFALAQHSLPSGTVETVTWWDAATEAETVVAPAVVDVEGTPYAFVNWLVDGLRYPSATATALNPAVALTMPGAREATAVYVPEAQDEDADGLPDWWELFNFSNLDATGTNDADSDGYSNASELADRSDPRNAASIPQGPDIMHDPLDDPMAAVSPWPVSATMTDSVGVASATLHWQVNGQGWTNTVAMAEVGGGAYEGVLSGSTAPGDVYQYRIEAVDSVSNVSSTPTNTFHLAYPLATVAQGELAVSIERNAATEITFLLANDGNADLTWQAVTNLTDTVDDGAGWELPGSNTPWHVSTQEVHSANRAWYCGDEVSGSYGSSVDALLVSPPVILGAAPVLSFWQWMEAEYDGSPGYEDYYWDGGVMDISTNGGLSFERIAPVGGYPHKITPNPDSPFPDHTPCFGGAGGWEHVIVDLSAYARRQAQVRFRFGSDAYVVDRGWFIDDVAFGWGASWHDLPTPSGLVSSASSVAVTVRFDATGLQAGTYLDTLVLTSNDPTRPSLGIPVRMQVSERSTAAVIALDAVVPDQFVITWPSATGCFYRLRQNTNLGSTNWVDVPGYSNVPGCEGSMSYTGAIDHIPAKFYRVNENQP